MGKRKNEFDSAGFGRRRQTLQIDNTRSPHPLVVLATLKLNTDQQHVRAVIQRIRPYRSSNLRQEILCHRGDGVRG
jgi:hypothetical protein